MDGLASSSIDLKVATTFDLVLHDHSGCLQFRLQGGKRVRVQCAVAAAGVGRRGRTSGRRVPPSTPLSLSFVRCPIRSLAPAPVPRLATATSSLLLARPLPRDSGIELASSPPSPEVKDSGGIWRDSAAPAQKAFANVINAISRFEPVTVCANAGQYARVFDLMKHNSTVRVVEMTTRLVWLRDIGPTFIVREGETRSMREIAGVDWQYNVYGGFIGLFEPEDHQLNWKQRITLGLMKCFGRLRRQEEYFAEDNLVASKVLELERIPRFDTSFVLEGGSIHVDGEGTCITTEQCLCHGNRNPHMTKEEIENQLKSHLGVSKVIWLPKGLHGDDVISGHVDNICCFAGPAVVLLSWINDTSDPHYERAAAAFDVLSSTTDAKGRKLEIIKIHVPGPLYMTKEEAEPIGDLMASMHRRLAGSYVNFYIANGGIIAPAFGDKWDEEARNVLEKAFPNHEVVMVEGGREIVLGGGNIHCATQQQPAVCPVPLDADTM